MKQAIVVGASSGMGRALAQLLAQDGYQVGLTARRTDLLEELKETLPTEGFVKAMDLQDPEGSMAALTELVETMGDVQLIVLMAGVGHGNPGLEWPREKQTIDVNVTGFTALASAAYHHFQRRGGGHLVGVSSLAGLRGNIRVASYNASKAFVINYLQSLRYQARKAKLPLIVTDIRPGFVDTPMTEGQKGMFWVASAEKAASQILEAIRKKRKVAYITKRWRIVSWVIRLLPDALWVR